MRFLSLQLHVLSETCDEDLRELLEEVEGVLLWSNLSRASLRLDVFSCDSEPESWLWKKWEDEKRKGNLHIGAVNLTLTALVDNDAFRAA